MCLGFHAGDRWQPTAGAVGGTGSPSVCPSYTHKEQVNATGPAVVLPHTCMISTRASPASTSLFSRSICTCGEYHHYLVAC